MNILQDIKDGLKDFGKSLETAIKTPHDYKRGKQSHLERVGIVMRERMHPIRYYNRNYPYVTTYNDNSVFNLGGYQADMGWMTKQQGYQSDIQDREFDSIKGEFSVE